MVLQNIVLSDKKKKGTEALYYRSSGELAIKPDEVFMQEGSTLSFDTYFNMFAVSKWRLYTTIEDFYFSIKISGNCIISIIAVDKNNVKRILWEGCSTKDSGEIHTDTISIHEMGFIYLKLEALEDVHFYGAKIESSAPCRPVSLAMVSCTYNRQEAITGNINYVCRKNRENHVIDNIYVIDNASNLSKADFEEKDFFLIHNPNTGGAGGFTRGMKEAVKDGSSTHILLLDDDVEIEFEAIIRTRNLISVLKDEYKDNFIGGAMLRMDMPHILYAQGELYNNGLLIKPYVDTDISSAASVIKISQEIKGEQQYAGWWYCTIPCSHIMKKGYPMPFFIHVDDMEYSIRSGKAPIFLNGIAIWHEEFENKRSSVLEYYDLRNRLITNMIYCRKNKFLETIYVICERFYASVFRYRYKDFGIIEKAVQDFLKGPEWLFALDSESYHKELGKKGYKLKNLKSAKVQEFEPDSNILRNLAAYLKPAHGSVRIGIGEPVSSYRGKKKCLLIDTKNQKGFVVEKSWKETGKCIVQLLKCITDLTFSYNKLKKQWSDAYTLICNENKKSEN